MRKRLTQEEFLSKHCSDYLDNFEFGEYKPKQKIDIKCKRCGYTFNSSLPSIIKNGVKCAVCDGYTKQNTETFKLRVKKLVGDEYTILGEYKTATTKIKIKHNKCGYVYETATPHDFLSGHRCPYCSHEIPLSDDIIDQRLKDKHWDFKRISNFKHIMEPIKLQCNRCGNIVEKIPNTFLYNENLLCPYCDAKRTKKIIIGVNTIDATNKNLLSYMVDKEFAKQHSYYTKYKTYFRCPDCGKVSLKLPSTVLDNNNRYVCNRCGDGFPYGEKFFSSILDENNINYVFQANWKIFSWSKNYFYDFYLPNYSCIVEINGIQHYKQTGFKLTLQDVQQNDNSKKELAISNGISTYIQLDCRYSDEEYIKDKILKNNFLSKIISSSTDFDKCNQLACMSKVRRACKEFNDGVNKLKICQNLNICLDTLNKYLKKGKLLYGYRY